jgi:hypothetical protein
MARVRTPRNDRLLDGHAVSFAAPFAVIELGVHIAIGQDAHFTKTARALALRVL